MPFARLAVAWIVIANMVAMESGMADESAITQTRAAVLAQPGLPSRGQASSPLIMQQICRAAGVDAELLSAQQVADPKVLSRQRYDLLVVPTGRAFPAAARESLLQFLRAGGDLVTSGGHAFEELLREESGQWLSERELVEVRRERAMRRDQSLVNEGGFEGLAQVPLGGDAIDRRWRRTGDYAKMTRDAPVEGEQCCAVTFSSSDLQSSGGFYARIPVTVGQTYHASGFVRTRELEGPGIAYLSVYQLNQQDELVTFRDFAAVQHDIDWKRFEYTFTVQPTVTHVRLQCGLFRKNGVASFDDIRLVDLQDASFLPINTSWGEPGDGLEVTPDQIGMFDPSYPLQRACRLRTAQGQSVVDTAVNVTQPIQGMAASGVVGYDNARWIPLLETYDRYDRPRGPAGALLLNYQGPYRGSCWAYFGVENMDLFADAESPASVLLQQVLAFLQRKTFVHNLRTSRALYRPGEPIDVSVNISNHGKREQAVEVVFGLLDAERARVGTQRVSRSVAVGKTESLAVALTPPPLSGPLCLVEAQLLIDGKLADAMDTGFVVQRADMVDSGPELRFKDNYLTLNDRPLFLFGSDTYSRTYLSAAENPQTWDRELAAARDMGMNLYENLQYSQPNHQVNEATWCQFLAMAQLTQQYQLVFMPGMLIGRNTAVGPRLLQEQSALCRDYAEHLKHVPGLLYYINGDYQHRTDEHAADIHQLWNEWLEERYQTVEQLRQSWQGVEVSQAWGAIPFPPPDSGRWEDVAAIDAARFRMALTTDWNRAHVAAVHSEDTEHPITSEYYSQPSIGIDIRWTIADQDLSNIGYFDEPEVDIDRLPLRISFADLRARGRGVSLGEYGVKTHPAWSVANGATGYHIRRTEQQQRQLFMAVAHYGLGLGCAKVQNWCLRDAQTRVFPWGIFYPNQLVPKDVAYVHRNLSLLWRHLEPRYEEPPLMVALASHLRLGNDADVGAGIAYRTFADLLALHLPFGTLDDEQFDRIPASTRVILYPSPFAMSDTAFDRLLRWVTEGGTLLITGDGSYDTHRRRTRVERMARLAGVRVGAPCYPGIARHKAEDRPGRFALPGVGPGPVRPCVDIEPQGAEVVGRDDQGNAILVRHQVGQGTVVYCSDPLELSDDPAAAQLRRQLYQSMATASRIEPVVAGDLPWLHVMNQPTRTGVVHVAYNTKNEEGTAEIELPTAAGEVSLTLRDRWPGAVMVSDRGAVLMVNAAGHAATAEGTILRGAGQIGMLSLDGLDLRSSQAFVIAPFEPGSLDLSPRDDGWIAVMGESVDGRWKTYEVQALSDSAATLQIDEDRATLLILICRPAERARWETRLTTLFAQPHEVDGY